MHYLIVYLGLYNSESHLHTAPDRVACRGDCFCSPFLAASERPVKQFPWLISFSGDVPFDGTVDVLL